MSFLHHFSGLEDVYHGNASSEYVAGTLRERSYNMMAWSGGNADKLRAWADLLLPLARNLVTITGYSEQDVRKNYQVRIRQGAFLTMNQDVLPMVTGWLQEQNDITEPERIILSAWATDTLGVEEAKVIVEGTVEGLQSNQYQPSEELAHIFGLYRNAMISAQAFNGFVANKALTGEDYAVALKAAVSANNYPLVSTLLDDHKEYPYTAIKDAFQIAAMPNKQETLNVLVDKAHLSKASSCKDGEKGEQFELFSSMAFNFIDSENNAALANILESGRRHNLKLDIGNGFFNIKNRELEGAYHQVLGYIRDTNQTADVFRLDLKNLLGAASRFGDREGIDYLAPYFSTHDITSTLVGTAIDGTNRDGAKALLEKIAERGYPIDLTWPIDKAAGFGNLAMLDEILSFATENHIKVNFDEVYDYIKTPRQTIVMDVSGLATIEKMQKITDALGAEGEIADIKDRIVDRLALAEIEQLQFPQPSPPNTTIEQQQQAIQAITGEWGERNYGGQSLHFPIGLAPAVETFLQMAGLEPENYSLRSDELYLREAAQDLPKLQRAITTYLGAAASDTSLAS
jgi:hypothetical protein